MGLADDVMGPATLSLLCAALVAALVLGVLDGCFCLVPSALRPKRSNSAFLFSAAAARLCSALLLVSVTCAPTTFRGVPERLVGALLPASPACGGAVTPSSPPRSWCSDIFSISNQINRKLDLQTDLRTTVLGNVVRTFRRFSHRIGTGSCTSYSARGEKLSWVWVWVSAGTAQQLGKAHKS